MTSDVRGPGGPWELSRDGELRGRYPTEDLALQDLHRVCGQSWNYAFKHAGWKLEDKGADGYKNDEQG